MPKISKLFGKKILDSRGDETIEVGVVLDDGTEARAAVPQGVSRGEHEAVYVAPDIALNNLQKILEPAVLGLAVENQAKLDLRLIEADGTLNKSEAGANTILGASLASARASAQVLQKPLWLRFREIYGEKVPADNRPLLFINMIEGGLHAKNGLQFQEYLVIPEGQNFQEAILRGRNVYAELEKEFLTRFGPAGKALGDEGGFAPPLKDDLEPFKILQEVISRLGLSEKTKLGLDAAGSDLKSSPDKLAVVYRKMRDNFHLFYLEDPLDEENFSGFAGLLAELGGEVKVVGDDLTATNLSRMKKAKEKRSVNGVIIKPNQIGTVTETMQAVKMARMWNWFVVVSHRGGETMDDFIADLAYGVGADGFKLGSPSKLERLVKYSRLLKIEENLPQ